MDSIDILLNHFAVQVNNGSGCLFQPHTKEYTYVLTVKHNLIEESGLMKAKIIHTQDRKEKELIIKNIYLHPNNDIDLALITVDYIDNDLYDIVFAEFERGEKVKIFGYPQIYRNDTIKSGSLSATYEGTHQENISFRITCDTPLHTFNRSAISNVTGFSGSGIFLLEDNSLVLKGIVPELNDSDGAFQRIIGYRIECFNEIIEENKLHELKPSFLLNFDRFHSAAFATMDPKITSIFNSNIERIVFSNICPDIISTSFQGKLYVPFTAQYRNKLINEDLWRGWLEYLTVMNILEESEDEPDFDNILKKHFQNTKFIFSSSDEVRLENVIAKLIEDNELNKYCINEACIVVNSRKEPRTRVLSSKRIRNILPDITQVSPLSRRKQIDRVSNQFSFSCLHLSHFLEEISKLGDQTELTEEIDIAKIRDVINGIITRLND